MSITSNKLAGKNLNNLGQNTKNQEKKVNLNGNVKSRHGGQNQSTGRNDARNQTGAALPQANLNAIEAEAEQKWSSRWIHMDDVAHDYRFYNKNDGSIQTIFQLKDSDPVWEEYTDTHAVEVGVDLDVLKQMDMQKLREMWKDQFPDRQEGFVPGESEIKAIRDAVIAEAMAHAGKDIQEYYDTQLNGDDTGRTFRLLREIGAWETFHKLAVTQAYYQFTKAKEEYISAQLGKNPRQKVTGKSALRGKTFNYESQGTNNCYACSMAGAFNNLLDSDPTMQDRERLDQEKIRSFVPRYLSEKEIKKLSPSEGADYEAQRKDIELFAGAGKRTVGNIMAISDVIFEDKEHGGLGRTDVAVIEKTYGLDRVRDETVRRNLIEGMKAQIHSVLQSKQMVSVLTHGHYVTIVGLDGNKVKYLDSLNRSHPEVPVERDLDDFLKRGTGGYGVVELTYMKKISQDDLADLKNEYRGMGTDPESGEVVRTNDVTKQNDPAHRAGIVITKEFDEMVREGNGDIARYMSESICLHKAAFMDQDHRDAFRVKNNTLAEVAQAEWELLTEQKREQKRELQERKAQEKKQEREALEKALAIASVEKKRLADEKKAREDYHSEKIRKEFEVNFIPLITTSHKTITNRDIGKEELGQYTKILRLIKMFNSKAKTASLLRTAERLISVENGNPDAGVRLESCRDLESLFRNILSFDMESLNASNSQAMVEKMNSFGPLFDLASDKSNIVFTACRKMISGGLVKTSLNETALSEIKERLSVINLRGNYYRSVLELEKTPEDIRAKAGAVLQMSRNEIEAELSKETDPQLLNYYAKALTMAVEREQMEAGGDKMTAERRAELISAVDTRESERSMQLETIGYMDAATEYCQKRNVSKDRRLKRSLKKEDGKYDKVFGRLALGYTGFAGGDDVKAAQMYRVLKKGLGEQASAEEKQEYADAVEQIAKAILSFDESRFATADAASFFADKNRYAVCQDMVDLSVAAVPFLEKYKTLRDTAGVNLSLSEEMLAAVEKRRAFFEAGKNMTTRIRSTMQDSEFAGIGFDAEDYLRQSDEERARIRASIMETYGKGALAETLGLRFDTLEKIVADADKPWFGQEKKFDDGQIRLQDAAKAALQAKQEAEYESAREASKESLIQSAEGYENSGSLTMVSMKTIYGYGGKKKHAHMTAVERERKMKNTHSELYKKVQQSNLLMENSKKITGAMAKKRRELAFNVRTLVSEDTLRAVSTFFRKDDAYNINLVREAAGNRTAAMDRITERFLSLKVQGMDLSTDDKLIANAATLENLSQKLQGYRTLLGEDGEYADRLRGIPAGEGTLYDKVKRQMDELSAVTDYYRARKLLITNPYYQSHYSDELTLAPKNDVDAEQRETSRLMLLCADLADRLKDLYGDRAQGLEIKSEVLKAQLQGPEYKNAREDISLIGQIPAEGMDAYLKSLEAAHRVRRYADGRIDLTQCTGKNLNALLQELENLKSRGLDSIDFKNATPKFMDAMKNASPALSQMMRYYLYANVGEGQNQHTKENFRNLLSQLLGTTRNEPENRLTSFSTSLEFRDPTTGESYNMGADMKREFNIFCRMADSEGMSDEEAMEVFDCLNVAQWKDCDMTDAAQAAAARKIYLKNMAHFITMYYEHHQRFLNTYGLIPDQMAVPLLALSMPGSFGNLALRVSGATLDDLAKQGTYKSDGKTVNLLDSMVEAGYLTREFADEFTKMSDHLSGTHYILSNTVIQMNKSASTETVTETAFDVPTEELAKSVTAHRNDYSGRKIPTLSPGAENKQWEVIRSSPLLTKDDFKNQETVNIAAMHTETARIRSIVELQRYINRLEGVESGGHSDQYRTMSGYIGLLRNRLEAIASTRAENGKNVSPREIIELRGLYKNVIASQRAYLRGKNRNHRNELYRRRYDIVEELQNTLQKDYENLTNKMADRSYSLDDVLSESREEVLSVSADKISKHSGAMSVRNAFYIEVNGQTKHMAFTERSTLGSGMEGNPYKSLAVEDGNKVSFPKFAKASEILGRDLIDQFFRLPNIATYLDNEYHKVTKKGDFEAFTKAFETFLEDMWEKQKTKLSSKDSMAFPLRSGNILLGEYRSLSREKRANLMRKISVIGVGYDRERMKLRVHRKAGILPGANLDMRNVAMSLMGKELGIENNIAYSSLARVEFTEEGKKTSAKQGILMEWIEGYEIDKVREGIASGEIRCDNEAELIRQLSDIQIMDYICGNIDRHMKNVKFEMEETGETTSEGKPILRIKRIVGIDNDLSFGKLDAESIDDFVSRLTAPEMMQVISRPMAQKVLGLEKNRLFLMLGSTVTEEEKASMWTRVMHLKQAIMEADTQGSRKNLQILEVEDFSKLTFQDLAHSSQMRGYIYSLFLRSAKFPVDENLQVAPRRLVCEEQRIDIALSSKAREGEEDVSTNQSVVLYDQFVNASAGAKRKVLSNQKTRRSLFGGMKQGAKEFNMSVGAIFSNLSTNEKYADGQSPANEHADLFENEFSKAHGMRNGILDAFYIDGRRAGNLLPAINEIVEAFKQDQEISKDVPEKALRDIVAKSLIMSYLSKGQNLVSIANYQAKKGGGEELVISDLSPIHFTTLGLPPSGRIEFDKNGNTELMVRSRKNRKERFDAIRKDVSERIGVII